MSARDWETAAACATADPESWFPPRGGDGGVAAKRICNERCTVRQQCLDDAMANEGTAGAKSRFGIRGGLGPRQRARLARQLHEAHTADTSVNQRQTTATPTSFLNARSGEEVATLWRRSAARPAET